MYIPKDVMPGHDRHDRFLGDGIRVVGDSAAGGVVLVFEHVAAKDVPGDVEQSRLRRGEEGLPDAAADVVVVVVRYLFLVIGPDFLFSFVNHFAVLWSVE